MTSMRSLVSISEWKVGPLQGQSTAVADWFDV